MLNKYDAIIVLAGGIKPNGELSATSKERMDAGINAFKEKLSEKLVFSGCWSFLLTYVPPITESEAMKNYAILRGVQTNQIFKEEKSKDTLGNAYFVKTEILIPNNWKNILVVTSDFHIPRTKYIFDHILGPSFQTDYQGVPSQIAIDEEGERKMLALTKEWLDPIPVGDNKKIEKLLFEMHPGYALNSPISLDNIKTRLALL